MLSIDTSNFDEAADALMRTFPDLRLGRQPQRPDFRLRHRRIDHGPLAYTSMIVLGEITTNGPYPDHVAIGRRHRGRADISYDGTPVDTARPYLRPKGASLARFIDSEVELIILERAAFESVASRYLEGSGRGLIARGIEVSHPASVQGARLWRSTADVIVNSLTGDTSRRHRDGLFDLAVAAFVSAFPVTEEVAAPVGERYLPRALLRAIQFLDEHLTDPVTAIEVADAARMSVRGIQAAFRRDLGVSPMQYHRRARLDAAHADLQRLDPSTTTVAEIAQRWGFDHAARFAGAYRAQFGRSPSETLRR